ncbi:MAG: CsbD family protein [Burkholderiales bacterium]|nr:CsbD family protein [Burkholderiales bacterium]MDE2286670.1 CsbD family protein [Burkholderiales bacterium]MDE2609534.1 CsbD family protein [Burkholderiales bacterium]
MNSEQLQGKWNQFKGAVKQQWGDLTDNDLMRIEGNRDKLIGVLQERYGKAKTEVEREVDDWNRTHRMW